MNRRRRELALATVELACGVIAAGYLVVVGVTAESARSAGRSPVDRAVPFVLAGLVATVLGIVAVRSLRRAGGQVDHVPGPPAGATLPGRGPAATNPVPDAAPRASGPPPTLSAEGRRELDRLVGALAGLGLLAPRVPDPRDLEEAVADSGEPVRVDAVLGGLHEAAFWRPGFRAEEHLAALAFHDSHAEQWADVLRDQVDDLARLVGDAPAVRLEGLELEPAGPVVRTRIRLSLDGDSQGLDYAGEVKWLSTELHVSVARALRSAAGADPDAPRLAWRWTDQGVWLAALPAGTAAGQLDAAGGWEWVDEQEATAAGDVGSTPEPQT